MNKDNFKQNIIHADPRKTIPSSAYINGNIESTSSSIRPNLKTKMATPSYRHIDTANKTLKNMIKYIRIFLLAVLTACSSSGDRRLDYALDFAGENRKELEKVLRHYSDEPEKSEAARFLISNMPRWYGRECVGWDSIKPILIRIRKGENIPTELLRKWQERSLYTQPKVYDAHVITADYLIENIDLAFDVWKRYPWNRSLDFDSFCELILPYRIGDEPLSRWRKLYHDHYTAILDSAYRGNDVVEACKAVDKDLKKDSYRWNTDFALPHQPADFLFYHRVGYCRDVCDITLYAMRACGIPVATDYFVYSPEYQQPHSWTMLRDTTGRFIQFGFNEFEANRDTVKTDGRKKGKVYRYCFGAQKEPLRGVTADKSVPPLFRNRFIKDVTADYFGRNTATVPVTPNDEEYVYLGTFSPNGWIPIDIAEGGKETASFRNLEPDLIYQPLFSDGRQHRPAGYPFVFSGEGVQILKPDTTRMERAVLKRKMSLVQTIAAFLYRGIIGSRIEGCRDTSFAGADLLYRFTDTLRTNYCELMPADTSKAFRFLRYSSPPGKSLELAELAIFADTLCKEKIRMRRVNDIGPVHMLDNITDDDQLTYFTSEDTSCAIVYDLGKLTKIKKIVFSPRNDDNYIWPGHLYELFYQDGTNGWRSLGKQTAGEREITYEIPSGALLWLRDLTKGKEEQVFLYRDGQPFFSIDL